MGPQAEDEQGAVRGNVGCHDHTRGPRHVHGGDEDGAQCGVSVECGEGGGEGGQGGRGGVRVECGEGGERVGRVGEVRSCDWFFFLSHYVK